jgi:hypothetical protein
VLSELEQRYKQGSQEGTAAVLNVTLETARHGSEFRTTKQRNLEKL